MRRLFTLTLFFSFFVSMGDEGLMFHKFSGVLSQNTVSVIHQDAYGFMWFGTGYGLNKYDGRTTTVFQNDPADSLSLANNFVRDICRDKNGNLWVACDASGISLVDFESGLIRNIAHQKQDPKSLSSNFVSSIYASSSGNIWIGTEDAGICLYKNQEKDFERYRHNADDQFSLSSNHVSDVIEDRQGYVWVATWGGGLNLYDQSSRRFIHYTTSTAENLGSDVIRVLHEGKNHIWVGTGNGVKKLAYQNGKYSFFSLETKDSEILEDLSKLTILSILEDKNENLWIGTENGGLFYFNPKTGELARYMHDPYDETSIIGNSVWSLYEDNTGNIWIGTFNKGICIINQHHRRFKHVSSNQVAGRTMSDNIVSSFAEDVYGNLWIGTDGGGLNYLNEKTGRYTQYNHNENDPHSIPNDAVLSLLVDDDNDLWVATWKGGVCLRKEKKSGFEKIVLGSSSNEKSTDVDAFHLMQDDQSNIWVAIFRDKIAIYNKKTGETFGLEANPDDPLAISSNKNRAMIQDKNGAVWIATEGSGVDKIELDENYNIISKQNYSQQGKKGQLSQNLATCLLMDHLGRIWIGTFNGLNLYDEATDTFKKFYVKDGLPSNVIYAIEEDNNHNIWVSTNNGLAQITTDPLDIQTYGVLDGLQGKEFYKNSSLKKRSGELLFGGTNGFNRFFPDLIKRNTHIPPVYVTGFVVSNAPEYQYRNQVLTPELFEGEKVSLKYDQNDLEFQMAVLNYSQPAKNRFSYKLENYDDDWVYVDNPGRIIYSNVPPGKYVFKVRGSNNDELWNNEGAAIPILINKPWWLSNWAYFIYVMLICGMLVLARAMIIQQERIKNNYKLEHLELTKMQEMDELKSRFFANISHEFRTPLTLILSPLKSLASKTYNGDPVNQFKVMERNAERLLRLINQLLDLSKLESGSMKLQASKNDIVSFVRPIVHSFTSYAEKQVLDFKCVFPSTPIEIYFEKEKLEKIVLNIISNAFKYTPEFGKITVSMLRKPDGVVFSVEDTGVGISEKELKFIFNRFYQVNNKNQKGTGIGLALTQELVELHGGAISVTSEPGVGSKFEVFLKAGSAHLSEDQILESTVESELRKDIFECFDPQFEIDSHTKSEIDAHEEQIEDLPIVLVAEDNDDLRAFIVDNLITEYKILETTNGLDAYETARDQIPDLIISDVMMPKMDGYELCKKVKTDEKTSHIPVIILTAKASQDSFEKGFETGADYYITKPFNPKLLELRIKNILNTRDQIRGKLFDQKTLSLEPKEMKIASRDEEFLKKVMHCIEENMSNSDFGVDDLCRELGLSRTQLFRKLKALVGQSANKFIRSLRLKRAAKLLEQSEMNISEITYQVGFNDLHYFRYSFKKQFGVNPSEYAKRS